MKISNFSLTLACVVVSGVYLLAASGCGRETSDEGDDVYKALLESERQMRSTLQQQHAAESEDQIALRLVQASPAPDGSGAVTQWIERTVQAYTGSLFPRWVTRKSAMGRYDVRFTCLVTDASGAAYPIGYAWSADLALSLVHGPRALSEEELRAEWKGRLRYPSPSGPPEAATP